MYIVLETVTPIFVGGANQRVAEIRVPSIRGALRFWFRALAGGTVGDADRQPLRELEAGVFGDTSRASSLVIRTRSVGRSEPFISVLQGVNYLFFSLKMQKRECLPVGLQFPLTMAARPTPRNAGKTSSPDRAMTLGLCSLWLLANLGGLGARSRRGAGSLRIVRVDGEVPNGVPRLTKVSGSAKELQESLSAGLTEVRRAISTLAEGGSPVAPGIPSQFSILHPAVCHMYVLDRTWPTWEQALDEVGRAYRAFRTRREPDYGEVKALLRDRRRSIETVERAAFGLPLQFSYRSLRGARATVGGREHDRRASPLLFKVHRLAAGEYAVLLVFFRAALLAEGERLQIRTRGHPPFLDPPDLTLVETFMEELADVGSLLEVNYR